MKTAKFGVLFFGMGLSMTRGKHMNSRGAADAGRRDERVHEVRRHADARPRQRHRRRRGHALARPAIRSASTCSRGYPRFNPGEFSTVDLLVRGDCDAALVLGADPGATMPQPAIDHLARIPTIVLDPKVTHTSRLARVHITTAATGISAPGTAYRMDEIPLPLRPALKSPYPTDEEVVRRINEAIAKKPFWLPDGSQPQMIHLHRLDRSSRHQLQAGAHASNHRRKSLRPRERYRRRRQRPVHRRCWPLRGVGRWRPDDRRDGDDCFPGRR